MRVRSAEGIIMVFGKGGIDHREIFCREKTIGVNKNEIITLGESHSMVTGGAGALVVLIDCADGESGRRPIGLDKVPEAIVRSIIYKKEVESFSIEIDIFR